MAYGIFCIILKGTELSRQDWKERKSRCDKLEKLLASNLREKYNMYLVLLLPNCFKNVSCSSDFELKF